MKIAGGIILVFLLVFGGGERIAAQDTEQSLDGLSQQIE